MRVTEKLPATLYRYSWRNNAKRERMYGRTCKIVGRGSMNTVLIEFTDNGEQEITSRRALRKAKEKPCG